MQALVKSKAERGLWLDEVPVPTIGINDVLIRVDRTGICGTDLHIYKWDDWARKTIPVPMVGTGTSSSHSPRSALLLTSACILLMRSSAS